MYVQQSVSTSELMYPFATSDMPAWAWPESQGFGLALPGLGLTES